MTSNNWLELNDSENGGPGVLSFLLRFVLAAFLIVGVTVGLAAYFR